MPVAEGCQAGGRLGRAEPLPLFGAGLATPPQLRGELRGREVVPGLFLTYVVAALISDPTLVYDLFGAGNFRSHDRE